jgi:antirestriction protein
MKNQTIQNQMPVVDNYLNILDEITINKINELKEDNYHDEDMIEFIKEYGSNNFLAYYEDYVKYGEDYSYDAVDAFVEEFGIDNVEHFEDSYRGQFDSPEEFAESFYDDMGYKIPEYVVVDWKSTFEIHLESSFEYVNGFVFNNNF